MLLRQKINLFMLGTILVSTALVYLAASKIIGDILLDVSASEKQAIVDNIQKDIKVLDELLLNVEAKWDLELSKSLPLIAGKIEQELSPNVSDIEQMPSESLLLVLESFKQQFQVSDIHLVNRDLIVFASTFEQEVGLDLSKFSSDYTQYLNSLFGKAEFAAHRLSLSDVNGRLKKYAYYSLKDSDLLVNVDIDVKDRLLIEQDNRLANFIFGQYVEEFSDKYHIIDNVDILIISETSQWSLLQEGKDIDPSLAKAIYNSNLPVIDSDNSVFTPIEMSAYDTLGFKTILHLTHNNKRSDDIQARLQYVLFGIALCIIVFTYLLLRFGTGAIFVSRFSSLKKQIKQKTLGDKKEIELSGNDELSTVASEVNNLMKRMERQVELNKGLHKKSNTDSLTTIANRRYFDEQLSMEWKHAVRLKNDFSILMIDIDFFKEYNDLYGHVDGDACLQRVAKFIESELTRPRDFVSRYGGEEFMCLLPETDSQGAQTIANSLRSNIQDLSIEHKGSNVASSVTVSIGCLTVNGAIDMDETSIIKEVDTLLYLSKTTGKNKVSSDYITSALDKK